MRPGAASNSLVENITASQSSLSSLHSSSTSSSSANTATSMNEETSVFPLMAMPKRKSSAASLKSNSNGASPPRSSNAPKMFFLRSEEEMLPNSKSKQPVVDDDGRHSKNHEEELEAESEDVDATGTTVDSTFGVRSLESDGASLVLGERVDEPAFPHKSDEIDYRIPHVTPLSTAIAAASAIQNRRYFSSTPLSQPLTPVHLQSPVGGYSPIVSGVHAGPVETVPGSGMGTPRSVSVGSLRLLSSDDEDEQSDADEEDTNGQIALLSPHHGDQQTGLSPEREPPSTSLERRHERQQKLLDGVSASLSEPQLIMPSIQIPLRRPFTSNGKNIGKLMVMIAGEKGIGKTSFMKSILRSCPDIVHVDEPQPSNLAATPLRGFRASDASQQSSSRRLFDKTSHDAGHSMKPTKCIEEVYASTHAKPSWWMDIEDHRSSMHSSKSLRRRKSGARGPALQRNVCFIDTPGHDHQHIGNEDNDPADMKMKDDSLEIFEYIEASLWRNMPHPSSTPSSEADLLQILSGSGGLQVHLVLYLVSKNYTLHDVEIMKKLSQLTNMCPIIGKADSLTTEEILALRQRLIHDLSSAKVTPFYFQEEQPEVSTLNDPSIPYAISSASAKDDENMDASLLMSPDYVQPLISSDLSTLMRNMFDPDMTAWLRHSAAYHFIQWRRSIEQMSVPTTSSLLSSSNSSRNQRVPFPLPTFGHSSPQPAGRNTLYRPHAVVSDSFSGGNASNMSSGVLVSAYQANPVHPLSSSSSSALQISSATQEHLDEHTQHEERLAQAHLGRWAADLQRSLQNERDHFEKLRSQERKAWLTERLIAEDEAAATNGGSADQSSAAGPTDLDLRLKLSSTASLPLDGRTLSQTGSSSGGAFVDPLGLILLDKRLRRGGVILIKGVVAGVVLGKLLAWAAENLGFWDLMKKVFPLTECSSSSGTTTATTAATASVAMAECW